MNIIFVTKVLSSDTSFSITLNITEISEVLKSDSLKYKLMVDKTGSSDNCDTSSNCIEVVNGDFSKMKLGANTIAPSLELPNNSRYKYYLFIYIDGNMPNDTSMQNGILKLAIEVCDIIVTLDYNGGNITDKKEYIKVTSLYTGLPSNVTKNSSNVIYDTTGGSSVNDDEVSYTFDGWYLEDDFKNKVTETSEVKTTVNHTLYAKWNPNKTITLPMTSKKGYTSSGWYNESDYIGKAGDSYNPSTSTRLTAHWAANNYTVTLDNQGATNAGTTSIKVNYNNAMPKITIPSKSYKVTYNYNGNGQSTNDVTFNYNFGGYFTEKEGIGTQYYKVDGSSAKNYDIDSDKTLYAKWTGTPITLPNPTRTGYTFNGWYNESDVKIANGGELYSPTDDIILIAHWTANIYKVTLDNQNATNSGTTEIYYQYNTTKTIDGTTCYYYTDSTLSSCLKNGYNIILPSKTGYTFEGYYTSNNGGGTNYINNSGTIINDLYQTSKNRTLYAKWTTSQLQVTYDYSTNGGTNSTKKTSIVNPGDSIDLTPIATKSGWTFIGWNTDKDATTKLNSLTMGTNSITLYAIYKKVGQITFNLYGNASFTYNSKKYTTTTVIDLCTLYNRATTCTESITMPTITASSNTPTIIGWSSTSETHTATYTSGQTGVTLTSGTTWYAQTKKAEVQLIAKFNANGANLSSTTDQSCTLGVVYNGTVQETSCTVSAPIITRNDYTIVGFNLSSSSTTNHSAYSTSTNKITLTTNLNGETWYAITYQRLSANFYYYNNEIKNISSICDKYNTASNCTITVPLSTFNTTKSQYGGSYVGYGAVNTVGTSTSPSITISSTTNYYVSYRQNVTEYYQNTSRTIYRNSYFTSNNAMSTVLSTSNTGTSSYSPSSYTNDSIEWLWYGYTTSSNSDSRTYSSITLAAPTTETILYTLYSRDVVASFKYNGESGLSIETASGVQIGNYKGEVIKNNDISVPNVVSSSKLDDDTYYGVSITPKSNTIINPTTAYTTYYVVYQGHWTATYTKDNNVASIGSTSNSCIHYDTIDLQTYLRTSCTVTLPTITVDTGYVILGWHNSENNLVGQPESSVTLNSDETFTAKAVNIKAIDLSYDNNNTGEDCDNVQCMIDKMDKLLPIGADELFFDKSNTDEDCNTVQCMIDRIDKLLQ